MIKTKFFVYRNKAVKESLETDSLDLHQFDIYTKTLIALCVRKL